MDSAHGVGIINITGESRYVDITVDYLQDDHTIGIGINK